jgi:hypothetical protein
VFWTVEVIVTESPWQTEFLSAFIAILTGSIGFTVITTEFDSAGLPVTHIAPDARLQFITSPLFGIQEKKSAFDPEFIPFTFHWKVDEIPAFVVIAVNKTEVPWQTLLLLSLIEIPI